MTYDLDGWKAIADTLNVSVRTAQRFRVEGLPIGHLTPRHVVANASVVRSWRDGMIAGRSLYVALKRGEPA